MKRKRNKKLLQVLSNILKSRQRRKRIVGGCAYQRPPPAVRDKYGVYI